MMAADLADAPRAVKLRSLPYDVGVAALVDRLSQMDWDLAAAPRVTALEAPRALACGGRQEHDGTALLEFVDAAGAAACAALLARGAVLDAFPERRIWGGLARVDYSIGYT